MIQQTQNFRIVPIFNQSAPGVWNDFIHIESVCDTKLYKLSKPTESIIKSTILRYKRSLREHRHNFAFAAYKNNRMIGFTQGFIDAYMNDEMYLERLYVLPKYHRCGIGTQLLKVAEQTSAIVATKISLTSLKEAVDFYQRKHGYTQFEDMEKELSPTANCIVPVFQWVKKDFNVKINVPVNTMDLKQSKYQPIFAHINDDCEIDAVATRTKDGTKKIWYSQLDCCEELLTALGKTR